MHIGRQIYSGYFEKCFAAETIEHIYRMRFRCSRVSAINQGVIQFSGGHYQEIIKAKASIQLLF